VRITRVQPIVLRLPEIELRADGTQDAFLVRIETDEGLYGIGEGDTAPVAARAIVEMPASHSIAQGLGDLLIGRDPLDIEPIWHELYTKSSHYGHRGVALHAISAIDIALYDLAGKILGQPVHRLLGGAYRDRVPVYASALMPWSVDEVTRLVSGYREQGYRAVKLGWGPIGADPKQDVALVRAARAACGPDLDLMIDAGRVWTWKQALQMARRFEEFELSWLEEPLPVDDLDGYARLCEHAPLRIASAENETTIFAFREWIDRAGLDIVQPDLARCGGFTQARRIAALTWEKNRAMVPHAFSTGILVAASLHMTAAMPHGTLTEFSVADGPLVRDLLQNPFRLETDSTVRVPTGPGLGIELDEAVVERFRVA
jgi:L-alanine-DL-glutamate epimerase-like enolase superfamily enzyme